MSLPAGPRPARVPTDDYRAAWERLCAEYALDAHERPVRLAGTVSSAWTLGSTGPDILLVHGAGTAAASWLPLVPHLVGCRVHLVDLPGFGFGAPHAWDHRSLRSQATEIIDDLLAELDAPHPILVGSSFGGWLVLAWSLGHPVHPPVTVLGVAPGLSRGPVPPATALRGLEAHGVRSGDRHARLSAGRGPAPRLHPDPAVVTAPHRAADAALWQAAGTVDSWSSILRAMLTDRGEMAAELDLTPDLAATGARFTYAFGTEDPFLGGLDPRRVTTPGARPVAIPGAGHLPWFERPRAVERIIGAVPRH